MTRRSRMRRSVFVLISASLGAPSLDPTPLAAAEPAEAEATGAQPTAAEPTAAELAPASAIHREPTPPLAERRPGLAHPIPAFSRQYRTACSTCHTAAPKLNVLGEAFRMNGYKMPESQLLIREDDPVKLGDEAWKDEWPRAIWPGDVPGEVPLALRIQTDLTATRDESVAYDWTLRAPHEVYLLAGANLGGSIGIFLETAWSQERGLSVFQAKFGFTDVVPGLPEQATNLWIGRLNPFLFTFADRQIDRAARQTFRWQFFRLSDLRFTNPTNGADLVSRNAFRLAASQPGIELNGVLARRFSYGVGVAQGTGSQTVDDNATKDLYYKVRYKLWGLDLTGNYDPGGAPVVGTGGQLLDRSIIIEHFGYSGSSPASGGTEDAHRSFGVALRALDGPLDAGVGFVHTRHNRPWGAESPEPMTRSSFFGKVEYLAYPWAIASFKFERFSAPVPDALQDMGFVTGGFQQNRVMPGLVFLLRQNVRGVIEGDIFTRDTQAMDLGRRRPHAIWARIDIAF